MKSAFDGKGLARRVVVVVALTAVATACERAPAPPATPPTTAASVVTIRARDWAFDAPAEITGGRVTFHFFNDGPDLHHVQLIRLADGKTVADLLGALKTPGPFPSWASEAGGPNAVDAGRDLTATLDVPPGEYALVCFVDTPDHVPHLARGMAQSLRVLPPPTGAAAAATQPADLTLTLSDFKFDLSDSVTAGSKSIDVVVAPGQPHEVAIFRLLPGKTLQDLMQWGASYQGALPANVVGGTTAAVTGITQRITVDFTPGEYVLVCFVPGPDGKPHLMHGMVRTFTVV